MVHVALFILYGQLIGCVWVGLVIVCGGVCMCRSVCNGVCGCNYTGKQGIKYRCTIQLLPQSVAIVCRVTLNAYSGVLDACADAAT